MTGDSLVFDQVWSVRNKSTPMSVSFAQDSNIKCSTGNGTNSFVATINCNPNITGQGAAIINKVDYTTNPCELQVEMTHAAGCPSVDLWDVHKFIIACKWIIGFTFIICGPIIGMVGKRMFPWIVAIGAAFVCWAIFCILFLVFGWMNSAAGFWICFIVAFGLACLSAWLVKKAIWFEVGLLGVLGGFFMASYFYSFIVAATGWESAVFYWLLVLPTCIASGILSWKYARTVVIVTTSYVGSYMFSRGFSYLCGGWPHDTTLFSGATDYTEFTGVFWVYFSLIIVGFTFFMFWQLKIEKEHKNHAELDDYFRKCEEDTS